MENLSKNQIGMIVGGIIIAVVALFGAWKLTSKPQTPSKVDIVLNEHDHIKGNPQSPITLVEYSDFQCPACKAYQPLVNQIADKYKDSVKIVYRHFPLESIHKNARGAAYAAEAAARQGKFWELHDELFKNQQDWENEGDPGKKFETYIKNIKGDVERYKKDLKELSIQDKVDRDYASGVQFGVNQPPTFNINVKKIKIPKAGDIKAHLKKEVKAQATKQTT